MAGTTSSIVSNLMSMIEKLTQFMHPFSLLPTSSSSSSPASSSSNTASSANSIQERFMEDLRRLERMLWRIQVVLHDAEEREIYEQSIQLWLSELREVAYDAEDVLDEYDYQVIKTQVEGLTAAVEAEPSLKRKRVDDDDDDDDDDDLFSHQVPPPSSTLIKIPISYNMAERIIKIVEKFDEITKDREALHLREEDGLRRLSFDDAMKRPPSSSIMHDSDVFGRENEKKKIIELLMSDSEKENIVIPIVGLGGVGKTTLAQLVYNDPMVCQHFSPKIWVHVSEEFDVLRITREIVKSIIGLDNNNLNDLQCMLKEALLEKRFLLILDDIWNERPDMWEVLQAPFSGIGMGKIIVTTRSKTVARIMQTVPSHELRCLDEEKSWLLFHRHAFFGWEFDQQQNFEEIGRNITKKCGDLPLALKAIGGFLRYEVEERIWKDVLNNDLWELEETKNLILPALKISYNHMPGHLKPCFVYASLFPKDHEFEKEELIRLWIAQGYIQLTGEKRLLEDIASEYFDDLQRRSFFQLSIYKMFTLHDMMHDLARSITINEICSLLDFDKLKNIPTYAKHIFIEHTKIDHFPLFEAIRTFYSVRPYHHFDSNELLQSIFLKNLFPYFGCLRVLSINAPEDACNLEFFEWIGNLQHLRYLLISTRSMQMAEHSLCSLYKLQTLKLESYGLNMLPCEIGKLINLRHLVLHCHNLEMLPKSICQLKNLQTLDIKNCYRLKELPLGISKLTNLRHLMLPDVDHFYIPCRIEKMTSLQTLPCYFLRRDSQHSSIGLLKHLMNLRGTLTIYGLQNVVSREDAKSVNLQGKPHIESLRLYWRENTKDDECSRQEVLEGLQPHTNLKELIIDGYDSNNFPNWFGNPHFSNLTKISLNNFNSNEECMFLPLSKLPSLISLDICNIKGIRSMGQDFWCYPAQENNFMEVHVRFPSLESLFISTMPELEEWKRENRDFPNLKILMIAHCPKLQLLPTLPSSLMEFGVTSCKRLKHLALHDSSGPPSRLQNVKIMYCNLLTSIEQVPDLNHLETKHCFNLKSVNRVDNLLTSFKVLNLAQGRTIWRKTYIRK